MEGKQAAAPAIVVGVLGTGMMGTAHAVRHSAIGLPVFIGSRDGAKGKALACQIGGGKCEGGTQAWAGAGMGAGMGGDMGVETWVQTWV